MSVLLVLFEVHKGFCLLHSSYSEMEKMRVHLFESYPESNELMELIEFLSDAVKESIRITFFCLYL